jgi:hypothetical protein
VNLARRFWPQIAQALEPVVADFWRKAAKAMPALTEALDTLTQDLPPTVLRCAVCGRIALRHRTGGRSFTMRDGQPPFSCSEHGELAEISFDEWRDEWTRRGRPERLNLRLSPVQ